MTFDRRDLERLGNETGFAPLVLEKVIRLGDLLLEFGRHQLVASSLLLKGGTPINLGFGPPPRAR